MKKLVICDWNRTLFNPVNKKLYSDVLGFLRALTGNCLVLVSANEIDSSEYIKMVSNFFSRVIIGEKDKTTFLKISRSMAKKNVWVVGDRIDSEIYLGNVCGFQTIRIKRGKFRNQLPANKKEQPKFVAANLREALKIILSK